uniref:hypothetical protein n=1 Tax=Neorhizobium sp. EC2-8 TaxID=3129230 RepID=UPI0031019856
MGEIFFDGVANRAGLLVGKIDPDRVGKDRVIEAKLAARDETIPFDQRPAPLACSIQIKTILTTTKSIKLSLSVAERLAQTTQPTFICIIRMTEEGDALEMRLVHLLDRPLAKILKRLREEFVKGTTDLNSKSITFNLKDGQKVGGAPRDLYRALADEIGPDMDDYAAKKTQQKKTLGYVAGQRTSIQATVTTDNLSDLVDGLLGLRPLPLTVFEVADQRFGIKIPISDLNALTGLRQ